MIPKVLISDLSLKKCMPCTKQMAGQKSITLETAYEGETIAFADKELIEIILRNLVSNAIKFTKEGGSVRIDSYERSGK